ncbi:MAG: hypothetical protein DHS20C15_06040 [Planctomycetota bacterium]|nr:MAG: hypothetical protein DHS20C15_06040 [Planctomycetota bacterium]
MGKPAVTESLEPHEQELLDEVAEGVVRRRLSTPAMMFLEMSTPLNMLGSSTLHMASPLWRAVVPVSRIDQVAKLLEKRIAIPALIQAIDDAEHERRRAAKSKSDAPPTNAAPLTPTALATGATPPTDPDSPSAPHAPDETSS